MTATSGYGHRSVSQYQGFAECGERYRLERVVRVPQAPAVWFPGGTAFHEVAERIVRDDWAGELQSDEAYRDLYLAIFKGLLDDESRKTGVKVEDFRTGGRASKAWPNGNDRSWYESEGPAMVDKFLHWYRESGWRIAALPGGDPAVEVRFNVNIGGVLVTGSVDAVYVNPDGELVAVDYKSGATTPTSKLQLATYAYALHSLGVLYVEKGAYYMSRKGELVDETYLAPYAAPGNLAHMFATMDAQEKAGVYLPNPGMQCRKCSVAAACVFTGGKRHELDDGPLSAA